MVEDPEVLEFLHGSELVFTTGIGRVKNDGLLSFAENLNSKGAAGLVVNLGPYISVIPAELKSYCNENDLPLFTIPWEVRIIDITFDFCSRIIENEKSELTIADSFINIIKTPEDIPKYSEFLEAHGFSDKNRFRIVLFDFFQEGKNATERIEKINHIKLWHILTKSALPTAMFLLDGKIAVIKQSEKESNPEEVFNSLKKNLSSTNLRLVMGVSESEKGFSSLSRIYKQAAAAYLAAGYRNAEFADYSDIGINKVIFGVKDTSVLKEFADGVLHNISEYDEKNNTDYEDMLRRYLESNSSVKKLSEEIGIHRNTVNYKIRQIKELFALELDEAQKAELILAFRIKSLFNRGLL